jgi:hypothetical protein
MAEMDANGPNEAGWTEEDTGEAGSVPEGAIRPQDDDSGDDDLAIQDDLARAVEHTIEEEGEVPEGEDDDADTPNREAAKWRHRLRETEAERDQLAGQIEALQRQIVEQLAGSRLHDVDDLWVKHDVNSLLDENGAVDKAALNDAINSLPQHLKKTPVLFEQGYRGRDDPKGVDWGDVLGRH